MCVLFKDKLFDSGRQRTTFSHFFTLRFSTSAPFEAPRHSTLGCNWPSTPWSIAPAQHCAADGHRSPLVPRTEASMWIRCAQIIDNAYVWFSTSECTSNTCTNYTYTNGDDDDDMLICNYMQFMESTICATPARISTTREKSPGSAAKAPFPNGVAPSGPEINTTFLRQVGDITSHNWRSWDITGICNIYIYIYV